MKKRLLAGFLAAVMLAMLCPVTALAAETTLIELAGGTQDAPTPLTSYEGTVRLVPTIKEEEAEFGGTHKVGYGYFKVTGDVTIGHLEVTGESQVDIINSSGTLTVTGGIDANIGLQIRSGKLRVSGKEYGIRIHTSSQNKTLWLSSLDAEITATGENGIGILAEEDSHVTFNYPNVAIVTGKGAAIKGNSNIQQRGGSLTAEGDVTSEGPIYFTSGKAVVTGNISAPTVSFSNEDALVNGTVTASSPVSVSQAVVRISQITPATTDDWNGIVKIGSDMTVYKGFPNSPFISNITVEEDETLNIPEGTSITINAGKTLTNSGAIINNGDITINGTLTNNGTIYNNGTITGTVGGSGRVIAPSAIGIAFSKNGETITSADYGDTIDITATITAENSNNLRAAEQNKVTFSLGGEPLGTADVSDNTATLPVTLTGENWKPGSKTVTAEFGGSDAFAASTGTGALAVQKATPQVTAPTANALTYTGAAQELVSGGRTTGGTLQYSTDGTNYAAGIPQGTDAGDYTVYYKVVGDDCYNDVAAQSVTTAIAKAGNSITGLTCADIVFGGMPSPSATATFGTPTYSYSNQQDGTYGVWNPSNAKGIWYVKAAVAGTGNYNGAEQIISFQVTAQQEAAPNASISYSAETLTGLIANTSYSITPAGGTEDTFTASGNGTINVQPGWFGKTISIVKKAQSTDYSDSAAQSLSIPTRPAAPNVAFLVDKRPSVIWIKNLPSDYRTSIDGHSWASNNASYDHLTPGQTYTVYVRKSATGSAFASQYVSRQVTTPNADGSTTVKPGESVEIGTSPKTTVTNDGEKTTITTGGTTTTVTPAGEVEVGTDGGVTVSGGSTVKTGDDGPEVKLPQGGTIGGDGGITIPGGGTAQVGASPSTTITVPEGGGAIQPKPGGTVEVPGGSTIKTGDDGPEITIGDQGGTVGGDGGITVPSGGTVQVGKDPATTITPPTGGEVKPKGDGTVEVPEGTTIKIGDGPEVTVGPGNGGTVGDDGGVTIEGGGKVTVKGDPDDSTITLPSGGGTVKPNPDGTIVLPGGSTVEKPGSSEPVSVPGAGGTYNPDTGTVTENVHTVTFNSQGGSAVSSATVTHGEKVMKPADPTRSGYTFGGWYKESGCTTAWNFGTDTVTGDMTLYAKWTQNSVGGGSGVGGGGSSTPSAYPPVVEQPGEGGSVAVSPSRPERGDTVTIKLKPDAGYEVDQVTVTGKNGKPVEVTVKPNGTYTFTQPNGKVKIEVTYKPVKAPWSNPFTDVSEDAWYYDAVRFVCENGLMGGYGNGLFRPNDNLSRAQLAQILFNKEGRPVVNYLLQYGDVATGTWYTEAVRWATGQGIVGGYGNGQFGPDDPITREQLAVMLWRYMGSPAATDKELHFADADKASGWAQEALCWAVENGIISGKGGGILDPAGTATRAETAQMLKNFLESM